MSCCLLFLKKRQSNIIQNKNLYSLEKQDECCICFEYLNETQLICGHNMHILCVLKTQKHIYCPICDKLIYKDYKMHYLNCKNKKCFCKKFFINEDHIVHMLITNLKILTREELVKLLVDNYIFNYKYLDIYFPIS